MCPAPCESACVLGINEAPVSIKSIECAIIDKGFEKGWISPNPPAFRTGKKISIIGSGPAGLAAADQLNKAGHLVTVYDRNDRHGGLLMYGIPNMKLEKMLVQRRIDYLKATGIKFVVCDVGPDNIEKIKSSADALLLCIGATWPRDLQIPNRDADGIHFAMEFLSKNTKSLLDYGLKDDNYLNAKDLNVVVIGGGDTGNDCIGTAVRHGAKSITNFEILPASGNERAADNPWPQYARVMKIDCTLCFNLDGHQEVIAIHSKDPREYSILSTEFVVNENNHVRGINTIKVEWNKDENGAWKMIQVANSEKFYHADLVLISMGFLGPENPLIKALGLEQDARYNIKTTGFMTSIPGIFAAGDCRRGQSLVVWGIQEGRLAAREIDLFLMGNTLLPGPGGVVMTESVVRR